MRKILKIIVLIMIQACILFRISKSVTFIKERTIIIYFICSYYISNDRLTLFFSIFS